MRILPIALVFLAAGRLFAQQDLHGQDLEGQSLKGRDLRGADLTGTNLTDADLTGADLSGAKLDGADFRGADLSKANLRGLDFSKASTRDTCLRGADLRGSRGFTDITDLDFTDADLRGADLSAAKDYRAGSTRFRGARYDAATRWPKDVDPGASGAKLEGTAPKEPPKDPPPVKDPPPAKREVGTGRDLHGKDFSGKDMRPEDLEGANLEKTTLWRANLKDGNLRFASLKGADLMFADLSGADLTGADLRDAKFADASLTGAKFNDANLEGVDLSKAKDLRDSSFRGANLRGLKGIPSQMIHGIDWRDADLRGADLANARHENFRQGRFRGAKYDPSTVWPQGFDPEDAGAVRVSEVASDDGAPPKLLAPDHEWDAPSEETVKRLFIRNRLIHKLGLDVKKLGEKPVPEPPGFRATFKFSALAYGRAQKGLVIPPGIGPADLKGLDLETLPRRVIYVVTVKSEMVTMNAQGSREKSELDLEMAFYKNEKGAWACVEREGGVVMFK